MLLLPSRRLVVASLYLLGNPDHYTDQNFVVFYWKSYVTEVLKAWKQDSDVQSDKVILLKNVDGEFIGLSTVDDYMYRSYELSEKSLYEWIQIYTRLKRTKTKQKKFQSQKHNEWSGPLLCMACMSQPWFLFKLLNRRT